MDKYGLRKALKNLFSKEYFNNKEAGVGIPKLYVKFWRQLFFGHEIHIFIPKIGQNSHYYS